MFRSETMSYHSILFSKDNAWEILDEFGHLGIINIEDLNEHSIINKRPYFNQIYEIDVSLEILREIENLIIKKNLKAEKDSEDSGKVKFILSKLKSDLKKIDHSQFYFELQEETKTRYKKIKESENDLIKIEEKVFQSSDCINVLESLRDNLPTNFSKLHPFPKNEFKNNSFIRLDYIIGVICNKDLFNFQKSLFRLTRGNAFVNYFPVKKYHFANKEKKIEKTVVFLTFQLTDSEVLSQKLVSLCRSFDVTIYPMPDSLESIEIEITKKYNENFELNEILKKTAKKLKANLNYYLSASENTEITRLYENRVFLLKQKSIFETLNKFIPRNNILEGRFWLPTSKLSYFEDALTYLEKQKEFISFRTTPLDFKTFNKIPPTLISTNSFSAPFQNIVDTYGVPNYKEVNPGIFTLVSFPFLFGLMFGDMGHGLMLFVFAVFLFLKEKSFPKQISNLKSLLLLMGFFAFYCGLIYNDFFALPVPLSSSCYIHKDGDIYERKAECNYPVGLDHSWHHSKNSISFINSFKMKLSIVIGVIHMLIGILMKGCNAIYFSHYAEFFFDFLPQFIFMICTFGYMVFCIAMKWLTDFSKFPSEAPSIIALYINFIGEVKEPLFDSAEYQLYLQQTLATIAVICVPLMLLGKPLILGFFSKNKKRQYHKLDDSLDLEDIQEKSNLLDESSVTFNHSLNSESSQNQEHTNNHDFSEMLIHQSIETIEFVLGSISNTASYLRLWALSLAHSQLAKVFFDMLLKPYISGNNSIFFDSLMTVIMFFMFFAVTFCVLMVMDLMECFLHALRLHWVEFQNKFYKGEGYKFLPFSFVEYIGTTFNY